MSTSHNFVLSVRKPLAILPPALQAPILGLTWVLVNLGLLCLGLMSGYAITCCILAGGVDGAILAVIVVATVSEKFQAGVTGLLSGYGLNNVLNGFAPAQQAATSIHNLFDKFLAALPVPQDEQLHNRIQDAVLWVLWTAVFVVLAALVVQWIQAGANKRAATA